MARSRLIIPKSGNVTLDLDGREVRLTNLDKLFWPAEKISKADLIQYYADVAPVLLPHIRDRAMVMKRYPHGAGGEFFFMKRAPVPRPEWIRTCSIEHESGNIIDFPVIDDMPSLLWVINLGCIDLNQWYATCDDVDRPDYVHFDLDPGDGATWERVLECGRIVHDALDALEMASLVKTTGSRGLHVYVPIVRGPVQKEVWTFAKALAVELAARNPALMTSEYQSSEAAERAGAHRLQPERLGPDARVDLFRAAEAASAGVDARDLAGSQGRRSRSKTSESTMLRGESRSAGICGRRC